MQKMCSKCKEIKDAECFGFDPKMTLGLKSRCKKCVASAMRDTRSANRDFYNARERERNRLNPQPRRDSARKYRLNNPEVVRERKREWYYANRELSCARAREWNRKNREKQKENLMVWLAENPNKRKEYDSKRRAHIMNAPGNGVSSNDWKYIIGLFGEKCQKCGRADTIELDHIVPLVLGGAHDISNIQPLCKSCNCKKSASIADYRYIADWT